MSKSMEDALKLEQAVAKMELQLRQIEEVLEEIRLPEPWLSEYQWAIKSITRIIEFGKVQP